MKNRVSISFWPNKKRGVITLQPDSPVTIYCRITVNGARRVELSTGLDTVYGNWMAAADMGHVKGRTPADKHINTQLTKLRDELTDIWADLERQGKAVTARAIIRLYKSGGATLDMLGLYAAFLAERKTLIGVEISASSYKVTVWRQTVLSNFLEAKKLLDLRPEEFTHNLADKFMQWCLVEKGYNRNNANKALQTINQCLRWGVRREHLTKNPLELYRLKAVAAAEIKYLNVGELQALTTHTMPVPYLERARDCFVFQCWTGLAYADLAALNVARDAEYHLDTATGTMRRVLRVRRAKSTIHHGYECVIPLLPEAERVLASYEDKLPVPSNQAYNRFLKEIGELCDLPAEKMTTHVGRKTAGVMMLNAGIRMETVSKFLGHSSVKMTEKVYAKILDTTVVSEFSKLFGAVPVMPSGPRLHELPAPKPEPLALRPARRIEQKGGAAL
jgi:integrase/recombinase XerD